MVRFRRSDLYGWWLKPPKPPRPGGVDLQLYRVSELPKKVSSPSPIPGAHPQNCRPELRFLPKHSIFLTSNLFYGIAVVYLVGGVGNYSRTIA